MKKVILATTVVVLSIAVFSVFATRSLSLSGAKKFENKQDETVRILNFTEEKQLNEIISKGLKILKIKDISVVIINLSKEEMEDEETLMGYIHDQETYYLVKLRPGLSQDYYLEIICHELQHLQDMYSGRLKLLYYGFLYDDVVYTWNTWYLDRPFEQRAFENEAYLKLQIINYPPLGN